MLNSLSRRDSLLFSLAGLGITLVPASIWAKVAESPAIHNPLLDTVCDLVIPATDTPGATAVRVPDYVRLCLAHADGITMAGNEWEQVAAALSQLNFLQGSAEQRVECLTQFDASAFENADLSVNKAWRSIKSLIVTGYYTSEIGGSKELRYDLVPGRFDADLHVDPATPELSNDWIAVNFR